ncbi:hypothetical protein BX600DRAFT_230436 [Xylariales sp. PMI_506]|nr:hypothetical protein BX600DRAFT_230436 [Xylariales sp. PMI_506]
MLARLSSTRSSLRQPLGLRPQSLSKRSLQQRPASTLVASAPARQLCAGSQWLAADKGSSRTTLRLWQNLARPRGGRRSYSQHNPYFQGTTHTARNAAIWGFIGLNVLVWFQWRREASDRSIRSSSGGDGGSSSSSSRGSISDHPIWDMEANWVLSWPNVLDGRWWTVLTCAASHQDGWHLAVNMWAWSVYASTAFAMGARPLPLLAVAAVSTLAGSAASLWDFRRKSLIRSSGSGGGGGDNDHNNNNNAGRGGAALRRQEQQQQQQQGALGASGLVCGLAAYLTCYAPRLRFFFFPLPFSVPLWLATPLFVAYDARMVDRLDSRIGHAAHVGGTAGGVLFFALRRLFRLP